MLKTGQEIAVLSLRGSWFARDKHCCTEELYADRKKI
jgi:hypothetical protein